MKRLLFIIVLIILAPKISFSQEVKKPVANKYRFDPNTDAKKVLADAMVAAKKNHTRMLIVVGGDWSAWSRRMYDYLKFHRSTMGPYELVFINFSNENKNAEVLKSLSEPSNRGYPTLMVLDENGKQIIVTDTDDMKLDWEHYDRDKINTFLAKWVTPQSKK